MKKRRNIVILLLLCCFVSVFTFLSNKSEINSNSLLIKNIEALTSGEHVGGMIECYDTGNIYCPIDKKAAYDMVIIYQ